MVCLLTGPRLAVVFPKGHFWGDLLFVIYINDLDLGLSSKGHKFADDAKLGVDAVDPESVNSRNLEDIGEWATVWQIPFNLYKCNVLHEGTAKQANNYSLLVLEISSVAQDSVILETYISWVSYCLWQY